MYVKSIGIFKDTAVDFSFQDGCMKLFLRSSQKPPLNDKQNKKAKSRHHLEGN